MKIIERKPVIADKVGRVIKNGVITEPHEDSTILYLTQFGIDVELLKPKNTPKIKNADIFIMGSVWEMKSPTSFKKSTIKENFRKASSQADRIIFDLRRVKKHADEVEKYILSLFRGKGEIRKLIIITKDGRLLAYSK